MLSRGLFARLNRPPTKPERAEAVAFIDTQMARYVRRKKTDARELALTDFAQVVFGLNEFIYVSYSSHDGERESLVHPHPSPLPQERVRGGFARSNQTLSPRACATRRGEQLNSFIGGVVALPLPPGRGPGEGERSSAIHSDQG